MRHNESDDQIFGVGYNVVFKRELGPKTALATSMLLA